MRYLEPIIPSSLFKRIEEDMIKNGTKAGDLMEIVAKDLFKIALEYIKEHKLTEIVLLCGKGNNGGDAFATGALLLQEGVKCRAYVISDISSNLSRYWREIFQKKGGMVDPIERASFRADSLVLDGIFGSGFSGKIDEKLSLLINNLKKAHVISIDLPSGLTEDGRVLSTAVSANMTVAVGSYKKSHFSREGFKRSGVIKKIDLGIDLSSLSVDEYLAEESFLNYFPKRCRSVHKYQVGKASIVSGEMVGASNLAALAALRIGAGIVEVLSMEKIPVINEIINKRYHRDLVKRSNALLFGQGLGSSRLYGNLAKDILSIPSAPPMVIDGEGIDYLLESDYVGAVITPHEGELQRRFGRHSYAELIEKCEKLSATRNLIIVFKGAPTRIILPGKRVVIARGTPAMATAGAGDVLSGIIVGLLAQGASIDQATILGTLIHGISGEIAEEEFSYSLIASDIISSIPKVLKRALLLQRLDCH